MKLSIIVPVYNSADILEDLCQRINKVLVEIKYDKITELILVNDSSSDKSWDKIFELSSKYSYIIGINLSENFGQHNALMAGFNNSKGEHIITLDDDLQHPPEYFS